MAHGQTLDLRDIDAFYWQERPHFGPDGYVVHVGPNRADRRRFLGGNLSRTGAERDSVARHRAVLVELIRRRTAR